MKENIKYIVTTSESTRITKFTNEKDLKIHVDGMIKTWRVHGFEPEMELFNDGASYSFNNKAFEFRTHILIE